MLIYLMWMKFKTEEVKLGRVPVGSIIVHQERAWKIINKIDGQSAALITNIGDVDRESILLASSAIVCYIIDVIKISKEAI